MSNIHIFDGAMGTMLQADDFTEGECLELLNVNNPKLIQGIHKKYLQCGATIITTNTFGANAIKLRDHNLQNEVFTLNTAAVKNAKKAINDLSLEAKVAGDMGPTGTFITPLGQASFDDIYKAYKEQSQALIQAGADYIIIETIIDIQEIRAALLATKDSREKAGKNEQTLPIICQLAFGEDGRTVTGTDPEGASILLEAMGADIIGANCSLGPEQLIPIIEKMAKSTNLPLILQPNAGLPVLVNGKTIFPLNPQEMSSFIPAIINAGVTYIGGCCGSTPDHIKAIANAVQEHKPKKRVQVPNRTALTSRTKTVYIGHDEEPIIIGERINPTGRKLLAAEIKEGNYITVKRDALSQVKAGAQVLDVNTGVPNINEPVVMKDIITSLSTLVETPLSIDSLDPLAIEAGLKAYPGRALINSVNAEDHQIDAIMPLAKRYGAAVLCLPLGNGYIPEKAEERCSVAKKIVLKAYEYGLRPQDLLLDPLVMTLASGKNSAKETLKTLSLYKEIFGFSTVMGLSNISFGLPQRPYINSQFLTMALASGLTAPIMNPMNYEAKKAFSTARTILGYDEGGIEFINQYGQEENNIPQSTTNKSVTIIENITYDPQDPLTPIQQSVEQGVREGVIPLVKEALNNGIDPLLITKNALTEAMNVVGDKFGSGQMYLPQVMLAAETMQLAFQTIKQELPEQKFIDKGTIILATVKGDIHDLGKNIVAALLENSGYKIIDLGKDVSADTIIKAIIEYNAPIVGLASLMTTTMPQIDNTIKQIRDAGLTTKVLVGGAVLTQEYADRAGADQYIKDGITAVKVINSLLEQ